MAKTIRIKLPSIEQVEFILKAEIDEINVRGNAIDSGNKLLDTRVENSIIERLNNGDVWAWASVELKAKYKGIE